MTPKKAKLTLYVFPLLLFSSPVGSEEPNLFGQEAVPTVHFEVPKGCELAASSAGGRHCGFPSARWYHRNIRTSESRIPLQELNKRASNNLSVSADFTELVEAYPQEFAQSFLWFSEADALAKLREQVKHLEDTFRFLSPEKTPEGILQCLQFDLAYTRDTDPDNSFAPGQTEVRINSFGVRCLILEKAANSENDEIRVFFIEYNELRPTFGELSPTFYEDAEEVVQSISLK